METKHSLHKKKNKTVHPCLRKSGRCKDTACKLWNLPTSPKVRPPAGTWSWQVTGPAMSSGWCLSEKSTRAQDMGVGKQPGFPPFSGLGTQMCWLLKYSKRKLLGSKSSCIPSKRTTYTVEAACHGKCMCCQSYEHRKPYEFTMKVLPFQGEHKDLAVWGAIFQ